MDILSAEMDVWGSGIYDIIDPSPEAEPTDTVEVYCDMDTAGGGWTVVWASMDEKAGVPWRDSTEDIGLAEVDPTVGPVRLSWERLRSLPQDQHIIIRPDWPADCAGPSVAPTGRPILHEGEGLDETDCYARQLEDVRVWTSAHLDECGERRLMRSTSPRDPGFARDVGRGSRADAEYPDADADDLFTAPDHILNGGWYGLALSSDGHGGLSAESCSQKTLNGRRIHAQCR